MSPDPAPMADLQLPMWGAPTWSRAATSALSSQRLAPALPEPWRVVGEVKPLCLGRGGIHKASVFPTCRQVLPLFIGPWKACPSAGKGADYG